jgi:hypothetical protein
LTGGFRKVQGRTAGRPISAKSAHAALGQRSGQLSDFFSGFFSGVLLATREEALVISLEASDFSPVLAAAGDSFLAASLYESLR